MVDARSRAELDVAAPQRLRQLHERVKRMRNGGRTRDDSFGMRAQHSRGVKQAASLRFHLKLAGDERKPLRNDRRADWTAEHRLWLLSHV